MRFGVLILLVLFLSCVEKDEKAAKVKKSEKKSVDDFSNNTNFYDLIYLDILERQEPRAFVTNLDSLDILDTEWSYVKNAILELKCKEWKNEIVNKEIKLSDSLVRKYNLTSSRQQSKHSLSYPIQFCKDSVVVFLNTLYEPKGGKLFSIIFEKNKNDNWTLKETRHGISFR